ncbi:MAG: hypothetical protein GX977_13555 [Firmicutes bacterium]|nr:hypothetical protein [Bacillota bacterium]
MENNIVSDQVGFVGCLIYSRLWLCPLFEETRIGRKGIGIDALQKAIRENQGYGNDSLQ